MAIVNWEVGNVLYNGMRVYRLFWTNNGDLFVLNQYIYLDIWSPCFKIFQIIGPLRISWLEWTVNNGRKIFYRKILRRMCPRVATFTRYCQFDGLGLGVSFEITIRIYCYLSVFEEAIWVRVRDGVKVRNRVGDGTRGCLALRVRTRGG